ncbi:serine/threonine-protein kinase [Actinomadura rudentiformis]|uniref:non-specific serine/threonine protein kinase n=1 Tax=Actinomadura rudentiformis TaxID=359158 RepID=A0A6H9Z4U3_9ACTN|nr:serine/threonine-protein kinase [Actinomadura rudentiformis]KAB2350971.1 serine/threonine protein kinase [Actinomadura rudentiformis]
MIPPWRVWLGMPRAHNHHMGRERMVPLAQRYRMLSVMGSGGMGTVWRAYDEMLDRDVAIKEVHLPERRTIGERRVLCRRLIEEARATAALRHPGVVAVHDIVIENGRPWIVMEFLEARSLHQILSEDGPLAPHRAAEIGVAVLGVLRVAHGAGILHRDVKPSNVLVCEDGRVLLTDFGLAVHMHEGREIADTIVAGIEGSPAYLSPERVRGEPSVEASDLWSLGATLYAAVEGRSPFLRCHALASMVAVLMGEYEPPARAGPLAPVIDGLLRQEADDRLSLAETSCRLTDVVLSGCTPGTAPERAVAAAAAAEAAGVAGAAAAAKAGGAAERSSEEASFWRGALAMVAVADRPRIGVVISVATMALLVGAMGAWTARWNSVGQSAALALLRPGSGVPVATSVRYHESDGYSVKVPSGWKRERVPGGVQWSDPGRRQGLRISPVRGDALEGLRSAERREVNERSYPGYRRLRLEPVPELSKGGAEWEFTWEKDRHGLRSRTAGYEFYFFAPDSRWTPGQRQYDEILQTFRPERS